MFPRTRIDQFPTQVGYNYKKFRIAEHECNKDELKHRSVFIEYRKCNFHWGKYFLKMIVESDSETDQFGPFQDLLLQNLI